MYAYPAGSEQAQACAGAISSWADTVAPARDVHSPCRLNPAHEATTLSISLTEQLLSSRALRTLSRALAKEPRPRAVVIDFSQLTNLDRRAASRLVGWLNRCVANHQVVQLCNIPPALLVAFEAIGLLATHDSDETKFAIDPLSGTRSDTPTLCFSQSHRDESLITSPTIDLSDSFFQ